MGKYRSQSLRQLAIGFTIVELLVVIVIVSLLVSLLLPAVQAAREATRRASCQNNLKQVGLALTNYESTHKALPTGSSFHVSSGFPKYSWGISWWVEIAPYLELSQVADNFDRSKPHAGWVLLHSKNGQLVDGLLPTASFCPSSAIPQLYQVGRYQVAMPSYIGISGASSHDEFAEERVSPCCNPRRSGEISAGGLLVANTSISFASAEDGLSNTLLVGEASDFAFDSRGNPRRIDGGFPNGWITGTQGLGTPPDYRSFASLWNVTTIRYTPNTKTFELPGIDDDRGANNPLISPHPGGVNGVMADGSVLFVNDEIDLFLLKSLATRDDQLARN